MSLFDGHNIKDREVYCLKCKVYSISNNPAPTCHECGTSLITVVVNPLTGKRITGENELARRNNKPT